MLTAEQRTIARQRERIDELEEELRQTRDNLAPVAVLFPARWGLTPTQQRALAAFCKAPNGFLSHEQLFIAIGSKATEADNLIKVQIMLLRKAVQKLGIKIITRRGDGYEITPESKAFIKDVLDRVAAE
jgi:DNA-binding response OmpR family regulator